MHRMPAIQFEQQIYLYRSVTKGPATFNTEGVKVTVMMTMMEWF